MWTTPVVFLFLLTTLPATASAQAAIVGSVRDPAGGPLSGVTIEAISPALIEGSRTTVTDASGRYRLNELRPGIYRVRFAMDGWSPTERSGIEVTGASTATVDATFALTASQSVSVVS
ncbi:MAG TPA: carboxypeptidase-like regulatory domain-containing protein, partial [Gemmataceae bacterium]|nr:carboxypeptidase-like regulatory domain-containing protein [Gemmataceae bacterium]